MMNTRNKKKINIKLFLAIFCLVVLMIMIVLGFILGKEKDQNLDYKLGIIADDGMALVSISNERKMINELALGNQVDVWIPNGMSWYNNTKIKNILKQEKKIDLAKNIFWYNFGFFPDKILVLDSVNQWKNSGVLINNLGFINWVKYEVNYGKMFLKQEKLNEDLIKNQLFLDEIMVRDFSESKINNEELRISIFNNTSEGGLANFFAKRLEWSGFSVISTDNNNEKIDKCLIIYGNKTELNYGWKLINEIFNCDKKYNELLNENEMELYFGDNLASMIKYSTYTK